MKTNHTELRPRIKSAVSHALQPLACVLAGWEGGSIAFDREDEYSDIDLNFLLDDTSSVDSFYAVVESALNAISPIMACHVQPPGRYFKLRDGGDFLLVDVCIYQTIEIAECLDVERHGHIRPLFDKGAWLQGESSSARLLQTERRTRRLEEHQAWFSISQNFVQKAIIRDQQVDALASYWGYTLKPLVELLRMHYCPLRWDFGMRYLKRDLPAPVYDELQRLMFVGASDDLAEHLLKATTWAQQLLQALYQFKA